MVDQVPLPLTRINYRDRTSLMRYGWTDTDMLGLVSDWGPVSGQWMPFMVHYALDIAGVDCRPDEVRAWLRLMFNRRGDRFTIRPAYLAAAGITEPSSREEYLNLARHAVAYIKATARPGLSATAFAAGLTIDEVFDQANRGQMNPAVLEALAGLRNPGMRHQAR